jgi:hypothetical protein
MCASIRRRYPRFTEGLGGDRLLRPLGRSPSVACPKACLRERRQRAGADVAELAALPLDPRTVLPGKERLASQPGCEHRGGPRPVEVAGGERVLRFLHRVRRGDDIDPCLLRELEPVAAERGTDGGSAVHARVLEETAELADDDRQRLLPRRRRRPSPQNLGQFVPRDGSSPLCDQVGEEEPTLPSRKTALVNRDAVGLDCNTAGEENLQRTPPTVVLPQSCLDLGRHS